MAIKITSKVAYARYLMWQEASDHLMQDVSHDPLELSEARTISRQIAKVANRWFDRYASLAEAEKSSVR